MELFTGIIRVLVFVIIGDLPLLVHFSCCAMQIIKKIEIAKVLS